MSFIKSALKAIALTFVVIVAFIFVLALLAPTPEEMQQDANDYLDQVRLDVAADAEASFELAKQHGSAIDRCVAAQQVAAAYQAAQSTPQYAKWKNIEGVECQAAGLSF